MAPSMFAASLGQGIARRPVSQPLFGLLQEPEQALQIALPEGVAAQCRDETMFKGRTAPQGGHGPGKLLVRPGQFGADTAGGGAKDRNPHPQDRIGGRDDALHVVLVLCVHVRPQVVRQLTGYLFAVARITQRRHEFVRQCGQFGVAWANVAVPRSGRCAVLLAG